MLLLKLLLTPLLIAGATLVGRRYGPIASGWLVGLPLTAGPVALFLALEQGTVFAAHSAQATLFGPISVALYVLTYCWCSLRMGWFICFICSWGVFFLVTALFNQFSLPVFVTFCAVLVVLWLVLRLLPGERSSEVAPMQKTPRWDLPARMLTATLMVVFLTSAAQSLGPRLSGLLSPLPIFSTILAVFTHRLLGAVAARALLRGVVIGTLAYAVFFLVVSILVVPYGIAVAFVLALIGALLTQGSTLWAIRRAQRLFVSRR